MVYQLMLYVTIIQGFDFTSKLSVYFICYTYVKGKRQPVVVKTVKVKAVVVESVISMTDLLETDPELNNYEKLM